MDMYKTVDTLEALICKEIDKMCAKQDLTPADLKTAREAVDLMFEIEAKKNGMGMDEYSERRGRNPMNGRYVSMNRGYSGHSIEDRVVDQLERMMNETNGEYEREVLSKWINRIRMG